MIRKGVSLVCALMLSGASTAAFAVEGGQWFVGGEFGESEVDVELPGVGSADDSDQATSLRGGYHFTPNLAMEVFYSQMYDYSEAGYSADFEGWGVGLVAKKNFGEDGNGFFIEGRGGLLRAEGEISEAGVGSVSGSSSEPYYGVGLGYDFSSAWGLGVRYTAYNGDFDGLEVDAKTVTAAIEFRF